MRLLVTGAGGFVGRAVTGALAARREVSRVLLLDTAAPPRPNDTRFEAVAADLTRDDVAPLVRDLDAVIHLASVPGGSAEADPRASRLVNLDASLALLEQLDTQRARTRFVYASSIAVLGEHANEVTDTTPPRPSLTYGAHKRMVEIAVSDFDRRGRVSGIALRLPGIVARPRGPSGLRSAFMSEIFHAAAAGETFKMPVRPSATMWLMSAQCAARNLVHAACLPATRGETLNLPALRVTASELAAALYADASRVSYEPDLDLEARFGALPPLSTPAAEAMGFVHDGSLAAALAAVQGPP